MVSLCLELALPYTYLLARENGVEHQRRLPDAAAVPLVHVEGFSGVSGRCPTFCCVVTPAGSRPIWLAPRQRSITCVVPTALSVRVAVARFDRRGFEATELSVRAGDQRIRPGPPVGGGGRHHTCRLARLTGIEVQENRVCRLLNYLGS